MVTRITLNRFEALAGWGQTEEFRQRACLKSAWATESEEALGGVYFIETESVFTYVLLTRDKSDRYRGFFMAYPRRTARAAEASVKDDLMLVESGKKPAPELDGKDSEVDLFGPSGARSLNDKFVNLRDSIHSSASRDIMTELMHWFDDPDGNFVKDFQTSGFDGRLWELYLFAAFSEMGFFFDRSKPTPDFRLSKGDQKVFVEAVTANPSFGQQFDISDPPPPPPDDFAHYIEHEMPQKFGSPLRSKIAKAYWEASDVTGHPFLIAIADFHAPASMTWSHTALSFYLYGVGVELREGHPNYKKSIEKQLGDHIVGDKVVSTNFFGQEAHKHVSAILFSNAGTTAKFNRMGVLAGFGDPRVKLRRIGGLYDYTPGAVDPLRFEIDIEDPDYEEKWSDEIEIYHNPLALAPLDHDLFPTATHFFLHDNELLWHGPGRRVLFSFTQTTFYGDDQQAAGSACELKES